MDAQFGLGLLLREFGRMTEAALALRRVVQADPTAHAAWFALGLTCQDLDDEAGGSGGVSGGVGPASGLCRGSGQPWDRAAAAG